MASPRSSLLIQDAAQRRATAATSSPRGAHSTAASEGLSARERLAHATHARTGRLSVRSIAAAIRRKVGPGSQLRVAMANGLGPGVLVLDATYGTITRAMADAAIARVLSRLGPEVGRIEILGRERGADGARHTVRYNYVRQADGTCVAS